MKGQNEHKSDRWKNNKEQKPMPLKIGEVIINEPKRLFFENINNIINFYSELSISRKKVENRIFITTTRDLKRTVREYYVVLYT